MVFEFEMKLNSFGSIANFFLFILKIKSLLNRLRGSKPCTA
jgi:hypothetical protein